MNFLDEFGTTSRPFSSAQLVQLRWNGAGLALGDVGRAGPAERGCHLSDCVMIQPRSPSVGRSSAASVTRTSAHRPGALAEGTTRHMGSPSFSCQAA